MTAFRFKFLRRSLVSKLILSVGLVLLVSISTWAIFNIKYQKEKVTQDMIAGIDKLSSTIKLGTHYAMMLNSRDDINQIINNIAKQKETKNIRIYNKAGEIKFSNNPREVDSTTNIKAEACDICHRTDPPLFNLDVHDRTRIFESPKGYRLLGIISPIGNEPGCSTESCHVDPGGKKILGALDVVVSMADADRQVFSYARGIIGLAVVVFLLASAIIFILVLRFVKVPIKKLIDETRLISAGDYSHPFHIVQEDEIGQLAVAINHMCLEIGEKQAELKKQRDEYQRLSELVPCIITVQNRDLRLISYNREFSEKFNPASGDYCFRAYKGRERKCENCPVEKTFQDGKSHYGEEAGINKDGSLTYWVARTSPILDASGQVAAVMEVCLDITHRKILEEQLEKSEKKYYAIFYNIPNPVFVLDVDSLEILDCNESVQTVYGYPKEEIVNKSYMDLFPEEERSEHTERLRRSCAMDRVRQITRDGRKIFVNIRVSPSEYPGQRVFLVTTSDITKRLEAEQQLNQASKMATLGEMATGIAHELNQPLSVIKTASTFFIRKIRKKEKIEEEILHTMLNKVDANVDRATKIITHMRQFARKSEMVFVRIQVNSLLEKAFEIFSQQLKVRGIEVEWHLGENLPSIVGDPDRLEQVFINLLINARDAIEERWESKEAGKEDKKIALKTCSDETNVIIEIHDTGTGIPEAIAEKIFEPFFTTKEVGKGTGLGLSISYGIIKDHGGDIRVISNPGKGASFVITIPMMKDEPPNEIVI